MSEITYGNHLMSFRLAYLRALAEAWKNPAFRCKLLGGTYVGDECTQLPTTEPDLGYDAFPDLAKFGFNNPWTYLKLQFVFDNSKWHLQLRRWVGDSALDHFVIYLPDKPSATNIDGIMGTPDYNSLEALALASYYQSFPIFFGPEKRTLDDRTSLGEISSIQNAGGNSADFLNFGSLVLQALATSWSDTMFKGSLQVNGMGLSTLIKYFGFKNPWNFDVVFRFFSTAQGQSKIWKYEAASGDDPEKLYLRYAPQNIIKLNFPSHPTMPNPIKDAKPSLLADPTQYAIALAAYNNTGPQYPFTCDCL